MDLGAESVQALEVIGSGHWVLRVCLQSVSMVLRKCFHSYGYAGSAWFLGFCVWKRCKLV